jgi:hypothetical protein
LTLIATDISTSLLNFFWLVFDASVDGCVRHVRISCVITRVEKMCSQQALFTSIGMFGLTLSERWVVCFSKARPNV